MQMLPFLSGVQKSLYSEFEKNLDANYISATLNSALGIVNILTVISVRKLKVFSF